MNLTMHESSPAAVYDAKFVPALFQQWGPIVAERAGIEPGMAVLDVGCGTGALTTAVAERVGVNGEVVGLDANPDMLAVAREKAGAINWVDGTAERLPFEPARFDRVVSQFAFMFFGDKPGALREMMRVAKPGGTIIVAVCGAVERSPGYGAFAALLDRLFGAEVGDAFRAPFVLGDPDGFAAIAREAGIADATIEERIGRVTFPSIDDLVATERACVWTLGGLLDHRQFETLRREAQSALAEHRTGAGAVVFDMPALLLAFRR